MMENHEFCDNCPGCRPAMMDANTGKQIPDDDPAMIAVNDIWDNHTTFAQRKAFIEVTLHNSRNPCQKNRMQEVVEMIKQKSF